jgi:DNA-binding PadR family transcriptional regulator
MPRDPSRRDDDPVPMKPLEFSVLLVLAEGEEYGYGIVKRIAEEGAGGIRLAPSNLYYVLDRMMAAGLVEESEEGDPSPDAVRRRYYRITKGGRDALRSEARRLDGVVRTAKRLRLVGRSEA